MNILDSAFTFLEKYNREETLDRFCPDEVDLSLALIGPAHVARLVRMPKNGRIYYLMGCGSWVDGGHEIGAVSGKELAIFQWG